MKRIVKILTSALVSAAILCGLLTPAFGFLLIPTNRLGSPDGVYWFDVSTLNNELWTMFGPEYAETTVYSQNGSVWYTEAGLARYVHITQMPDASWQTRTLSSALSSPDNGMMWVQPGGNWIEWGSYWDTQIDPMPEYLYLISGSEAMTVTPIEAGALLRPVSVYGYSSVSQTGTRIHFVAEAAPSAGVLMSTTMNEWKTVLTCQDLAAGMNNGYSGIQYTEPDPEITLYPVGSVNPFNSYGSPMYYTTTINTTAYPRFNITNSVETDSFLCQFCVYFNSVRDCTISLNMAIDGSGSSYIYAMPSFDSVEFTEAQPEIWTGDGYASYYSYAPYGQGQVRPILNAQCGIYQTLNAGFDAWADDVNGNYIVDPTDQLSDPALLGNTVSSTSETNLRLHLRAGTTYRIPVLIWAEGQDPCAYGIYSMNDVIFHMVIHDEPGADESCEYPFTFRETENDITITNFNAQFIRDPNYNYNPSPSYDFCFYDMSTGTLMLPSMIHGKPVTAIADYALLGITDSAFYENPNYYNNFTVQTLILPNTLRYIGERAIGDIPDRVHVPFDAVPTPYSLMPQGYLYQNTQHTLTVCCDMPNSMTQRVLTDAGLQNQFTFVQCTEHGTSHTHAFGEWVVTTEPICMEDGVRTRTCTGCGETETETLPALGHDFGEWVVTTPATQNAEGVETRICPRCGETETRAVPILVPDGQFTVSAGRAHPGGTVQVTVSAESNPGIASALLRVQYDPQILTLTAVENGTVFDDSLFHPGGDLSAIPYAMCWTDPLAETDNTSTGKLVTLTFDVAANAPLGTTAVTVTYDAESTFDCGMHDVVFSVVNDSVNIIARMPGDSDGDGVLSLKDATAIVRYLVGGWDETPAPDLMNADVNGDGKVNLKDVTLLRRYLAGWDVHLI